MLHLRNKTFCRIAGFVLATFVFLAPTMAQGAPNTTTIQNSAPTINSGCDDFSINVPHQVEILGITYTVLDLLGASVRFCWNDDGVWITNFTPIARQSVFFEPTTVRYERQDPGGDRSAEYRWLQGFEPKAGFRNVPEVRSFEIVVELQLRHFWASNQGSCVFVDLFHEGNHVARETRGEGCT